MGDSLVKFNEPPILFYQTQAFSRRLKKLLSRPAITYWSSYQGNACCSGTVNFYEFLNAVAPQGNRYRSNKRNGGNRPASIRTSKLIRQYIDSLITPVPLPCASSATIITFGINEIDQRIDSVSGLMPITRPTLGVRSPLCVVYCCFLLIESLFDILY